MKKIFVGVVMLALSSCYMQGDYTLGRRNMFNDFFYTYNIRYYDEDVLSNAVRETETVNNYKLGAARHSVPGGVILSSKTVEKEIYSEAFVRPTTKGSLVSYTVPVEFSDEQVYQIIGEVEIKGDIYRLIKPNRIGDVILIDERGDIYPRVGRIYNHRLALLDTSFLLEPRDARFINETENRLADEHVLSGFEVRYGGINDYRMIFEYYSLRPDGTYTEEDQKIYSFPMYDKNVSFEGIELEILDADESGIEYRVLHI